MPTPKLDLTAEPVAPSGPVDTIVLVPIPSDLGESDAPHGDGPDFDLHISQAQFGDGSIRPPVALVSDLAAPGTPHGDGPEYDLPGPNVHFGDSPIPPPPLMGISVTPSSIPGELFVQAWKVNNPAESQPLITEFGGSIQVSALPKFFSYVETQFDPGPHYMWPWEAPHDHGDSSQRVVQTTLSQPMSGAGEYYGNQFGQSLAVTHSEPAAPKGELGNFGNITAPPPDYASYAPFTGQAVSSASMYQRTSDIVFQSYAALPISLSFDVAVAAPIGAKSASADLPLPLDESESGFVRLDGSNPSDPDSSAETAYDAETAAIDEVLAGLHDFYPASDGNSDANGVGLKSSEIAADQDAGMQGGMVLLRSADPVDGNASAIASAGELPIDWTVPDGKVQMDVTVGVYQAFDVASGELTSAKTSLPSATILPTKQQEQPTKVNVSADKTAKPAKDQASAWVEMFTAAAVVGVSKRKRKTRSQA